MKNRISGDRGVAWLREWGALFGGIPRWAWVWGLVASCVFLHVGVLVAWCGLAENRLDQGVAQWVHGHAWLRGAWAVQVTKLGDGGWVQRLCGLTLVALMVVRRWDEATGVLLAVLGKDLLVGRLQQFYGRVRPDFPDIDKIASYGYPSGHTSGAVVLFAAWILLAWTLCPKGRLRQGIIGLAVVCILGVGITRVTLLAHWVTDVVGGIGFGVSWSMFCILGSRRLTQLRSRFSQAPLGSGNSPELWK